MVIFWTKCSFYCIYINCSSCCYLIWLADDQMLCLMTLLVPVTMQFILFFPHWLTVCSHQLLYTNLMNHFTHILSIILSVVSELLSVFFFSFPQFFLSLFKHCLSILSERCGCFPHVRIENIFLDQTPQVWLTNKLCDRSDADELSRCFKGSFFFFFRAHWNAERNNMKGKWSLQAVVSYSLQFPRFAIGNAVALACIGRGRVLVSSKSPKWPS